MNTEKSNLLPKIHLAAISSPHAHNVDAILNQVLQSLLEEGWKIDGVLQRQVSEAGCGLQLERIRDGGLHRVTQNLGSGSVSCNVDTNAMDTVSMQLLTDLDNDLDLLVLNRFGKRESTGGGFCHVIEKAIELKVPVLTIVKDAWLASWHTYGEELVTVLPAQSEDIATWCHSTSRP